MYVSKHSHSNIPKDGDAIGAVDLSLGFGILFRKSWIASMYAVSWVCHMCHLFCPEHDNSFSIEPFSHSMTDSLVEGDMTYINIQSNALRCVHSAKCTVVYGKAWRWHDAHKFVFKPDPHRHSRVQNLHDKLVTKHHSHQTAGPPVPED
jgi:hypothetical protein